MKKLFVVVTMVLVAAGCGCKSKPKEYPKPDTTEVSADFPSNQSSDGRAMPEYTPYWKKK